MYKKLIAVILSLAMVLSTAAPALAFTAADVSDTENALPPAVSTEPFMPKGTEIPDIPELSEIPDMTDEAETPETEALPEESETPDMTETPDEAEPPAEEEVTEPEQSEEDREAEEKKAKEEAEKKAKKEAEEKAATKYRNGLAAYMRKINPKLGKQWSRNLAQTFIDIGEKYDLDPTVLMALAQRESRFYSKAKSPYGYKGMMQTSDWLAKHYGYEPKELYEYEVSITVAARYLKSLKKSFGTYTLALAGYMYGGTAVKKGNFSKKGAWKVMDTRDEIREYLEKYDFV